MMAIDTNVIVRLLTNDEPCQTKKAARFIEDNPVFVSKTVLLETEWVLRAAYKLNREIITEAFRKLLGLPNIHVEDALEIKQVLDVYSQGFDFADILHVSNASNHKAEQFVTFDKKLSKRSKIFGLNLVEL